MARLKERIHEDMKAAMRARQTARLSTIRMLLAAVRQVEIDERLEAADDIRVLGIVERLIKQRRDSVAAFEQAGRQELADAESAEIAVLQEYLPQQATEAEVGAAVDAAIAAAGATGMKDMGKVVGALKAQLAGRADMARVSALVRERLGGKSA